MEVNIKKAEITGRKDLSIDMIIDDNMEVTLSWLSGRDVVVNWEDKAGRSHLFSKDTVFHIKIGPFAGKDQQFCQWCGDPAEEVKP